MLPIKARQNGGSQARAIHLHNLFMLEEFVEAATEMPSGFYYNGVRLADIKAEMFEEGGISALRADGNHHHGYATDL
jgi:hypothetical protein